MKEIDKYRSEIDAIDNNIRDLFEKRIAITTEIAKYKKKNKLPVLNSMREREIIARVTKNQPDMLASLTKTLFNTIFDLSKANQTAILGENSETSAEIRRAIAETPTLMPKSAVVACQGTEGSNSQHACEKCFDRPDILYFNSFDGVFNAVENGLCKYGILPIENSLHGSVRSVYDAMITHKFHIVRSVKLKINHFLVAKGGVKLEDIREIYSHEQALSQCSKFLSSLKNVKLVECKNTAIAAKMVSESDRCDIAAISSVECAELYDLAVLKKDIQSNDNNYTRFICISKDLEIYPGANKISLMLTIPHKPGSLYELMSQFSALGVNLTKLESRPIQGRDFEFMFYFEMDASVCSDEIISLISHLECTLDSFSFLGNYSEI